MYLQKRNLIQLFIDNDCILLGIYIPTLSAGLNKGSDNIIVMERTMKECRMRYNISQWIILIWETIK